jgi:rhamnosyltransferase
MKPLASVIIPALDEEKNLHDCLHAVFGQKADFEFEVLLIDSGSTDHTLEIAAEFEKSHRLRVLQVPRKEFSHGRTRRYGSEQAQGEFIVCLVADAMPANDQWLSHLVAACQKDDRIAGAYSRQLPRPGAGIIETIRLAKRIAGKDQPRIAELANPDEFWMLEPLQRILLCDFDDVSSVRRGSVLEKIPIPDRDWAEDLVWSRECLLHGHKIAYARESAVYHSHALSKDYLFKRGRVDQQAALREFGHVYYQDFPAAMNGFFIQLGRELGEIMARNEPLSSRISAALADPGLLWAEVRGRRLAVDSIRPAPDIDLQEELTDARIDPPDLDGHVAKTVFTVGNRPRPVILANPPCRIGFEIRVAEGAQFRFGMGVKPEAFRYRKAPVDFKVFVDREEVFKHTLTMQKENLIAWKDACVDLAKWRGKVVRMTLVTESEDTDHAWAGWAEPGIFLASAEQSARAEANEEGKMPVPEGTANFRHN